MKVLIALLAICLTTSSFAGLGETLEQTVQRYGPILNKSQNEHLPPSKATWLYEFYKNGFRIQVSFVNGKCAWILYIKDGQPIFETELRTLLENNAEGSAWSAVAEKREWPFKKKISYSRADGLADATYQELDSYNGLGIITKTWREMTSRASGL